MDITHQSIIGIIAGIISIIAYLLYNLSILRHQTKPNKATWIILTLVGLLILISYYLEGARETIWVPIAYVVGPLIIAVLAIKWGEKGWSRLDKICLAGSGISILFWFFTNSALLTLLINILIDFLALLPTIKKSYNRPETEDRVAWLLETIASVINILAIKTWIFSIYIYPIYLIVVNGVISFLLLSKIGKNKSFRD